MSGVGVAWERIAKKGICSDLFRKFYRVFFNECLVLVGVKPGGKDLSRPPYACGFFLVFFFIYLFCFLDKLRAGIFRCSQEREYLTTTCSRDAAIFFFFLEKRGVE